MDVLERKLVKSIDFDITGRDSRSVKKEPKNDPKLTSPKERLQQIGKRIEEYGETGGTDVAHFLKKLKKTLEKLSLDKCSFATKNERNNKRKLHLVCYSLKNKPVLFVTLESSQSRNGNFKKNSIDQISDKSKGIIAESQNMNSFIKTLIKMETNHAGLMLQSMVKTETSHQGQQKNIESQTINTFVKSLVKMDNTDGNTSLICRSVVKLETSQDEPLISPLYEAHTNDSIGNNKRKLSCKEHGIIDLNIGNVGYSEDSFVRVTTEKESVSNEVPTQLIDDVRMNDEYGSSYEDDRRMNEYHSLSELEHINDNDVDNAEIDQNSKRGETDTSSCSAIIIKPCYVKLTRLEYSLVKSITSNDSFDNDIDKSQSCPCCNKSFIRKDSFDLHLAIHKGIKLFSCKNCCKKFYFRYDLNEHQQFHTRTLLHACSVCKKRFGNKQALNKHKQFHATQHRYRCPECEKTFSHVYYLKIHKCIHRIQRPYMCTVCGLSFTRESILQNHIKEHQGNELIYRCNSCSNYFSHTELQVHKCQKMIDILMQKQNKIKRCNFCNKKFKTKRSLKMHSCFLIENLETLYSIPSVKSSSRKTKSKVNRISRDNLILEQSVGSAHLSQSKPKSNKSLWPFLYNNSDVKNKSVCRANSQKIIPVENCSSLDWKKTNDPNVTNVSTELIHRDMSTHMLKCETLPYIFASDKHFDLIYASPSIDKPRYSCKFCDKPFITHLGLTTHLNRVHLIKDISDEHIIAFDKKKERTSEQINSIIENKPFILSKSNNLRVGSETITSTQSETITDNVSMTTNDQLSIWPISSKESTLAESSRSTMTSEISSLSSRKISTTDFQMSVFNVENVAFHDEKTKPLFSKLKIPERLPYNFASDKPLDLHYPSPSKIKPPYLCKFCDKSFISHLELMTHLNRVNLIKDISDEHIIAFDEKNEITSEQINRMNANESFIHPKSNNLRFDLKMKTSTLCKTAIDNISMTTNDQLSICEDIISNSTYNKFPVAQVSFPLSKAFHNSNFESLHWHFESLQKNYFTETPCALTFSNSRKITAIVPLNKSVRVFTSKLSSIQSSLLSLLKHAEENLMPFTQGNKRVANPENMSNIKKKIIILPAPSFVSPSTNENTQSSASTQLDVHSPNSSVTETSSSNSQSSDTCATLRMLILRKTVPYSTKDDNSFRQNTSSSENKKNDFNLITKNPDPSQDEDDIVMQPCESCSVEMQNGKEELKSKCEACERRFCCETRMRDHRKMYRECNCGKRFAEEVDKICHEEKLSLRKYPELRTKNKSEQPKPRKKENKEKREPAKFKTFVCSYCGKIFKRRDRFKKHLRTHEEPPTYPFLCHKCPKKFRRKEGLEDHLLGHDGIKSFQCSACLEYFTSKSSLYNHKNSVHENKRKRNERKFECEFCGKKYTTTFALDIHVRCHTGDKPFKCTECSKSFRTQYILNIHIKYAHTNERNFKCEHCDKTFVTKYNMKIHIRSHFKDKAKKNKEKDYRTLDLKKNKYS